MLNPCAVTIAAVVFLAAGCGKSPDLEKGAGLVNTVEYTCNNGMQPDVVYYIARGDTHHVRVRIDAAEYDLIAVPSASGAKYSDGKYTWWTRGDSGLFEIDGVIMAAHCVEKAINGK